MKNKPGTTFEEIFIRHRYGAGFKSGAGFTLIELIAVVSVISILSVIGIASFNNFNQGQILQAAASDVATMLNLAKSRAQSQVKPSIAVCVPPPPRPLREYQVRIVTSGSANQYILRVQCGGTNAPVSAKRLPSNIRFQSASPSTYVFPVLTGGVVNGGEIKLGGYGHTKTIKIDQAGGITIE